MYAERDIILMDDPISALDANVKKTIAVEVSETPSDDFCPES